MNAPALSPYIGIGVIVVSLLGMLVLLRYCKTRYQWQPESTRKLAHIGLGLASLSYPFLFHENWPVLVLGALAIGTLSALRWVPFFRAHVGPVVHDVNRASGGELYFPIAATALFLLAKGDTILYLIPILTLTVADTVAALIGLSYGKTPFGDDGARKSIEGSIAFFLVAFLASHIPLLLFTDTGRVESLLIGLTMGVLLMLLEAIAWRGLDNLFIPLGGFLLLRAFIGLDATALGARLAVTLLLLVFILFMRRYKSLGDNAMLAGVLVGYMGWSAGGWTWLVPPLVFFALYNVVFPRSDQMREHPHSIISVLNVTATGLGWLLLSAVLHRTDFYYPYTLAFAVNMCSYGITWYRDYRRSATSVEIIVATATVSWVSFFIPFFAIEHAQTQALLASLVAVLPLLVGAALQVLFIPHVRHRASAEYPWHRQVAISTAISAVGLYMWHLLPTQ